MKDQTMTKDYLRTLLETLLKLLETSSKETVMQLLETMIEELK